MQIFSYFKLVETHLRFNFDFLNSIRANLSFALLLISKTVMQAHLNGMSHVFFTCCQFQILYEIILFIAVNMINLKIFSNKTVICNPNNSMCEKIDMMI